MADFMIFMTQDALPADEYLVEHLLKPLEADEKVGAAYARQLPKQDCRFIECYTRSFNYPSVSFVKWEKDTGIYGIKTYFCSNVCAAYNKEIYKEVGGFVDRAIFNEDMIYAGNIAKKGYGIAYQADACVYHSHNYSCSQQFHRNFDLGVSQAEHPGDLRLCSFRRGGDEAGKADFGLSSEKRTYMAGSATGAPKWKQVPGVQNGKMDI